MNTKTLVENVGFELKRALGKLAILEVKVTVLSDKTLKIGKN